MRVSIIVLILIFQKCQSLQWLRKLFNPSPSSADFFNILQKIDKRLDFLEAGQQKLEVGQQKLEVGQQKLEAGQQKLEAGQQNLEAGQQNLEAGQQKLEIGVIEIKADIKSLNKTVRETSQYNRNRDKELEIIILKSFQQNLEDAGWTVNILDIDKIYSVGGELIAEWDGCLHAKHREVAVPILFFLETKQVFTELQYIRAKEQMTKTQNILDSIDFSTKKTTGQSNFKKMKSKLLSCYDEVAQKPAIKLVVGSPFFEKMLLEKLQQDHVPSISRDEIPYILRFNDVDDCIY